MQAYLLALLEEDARRARNVMLLKQVREHDVHAWRSEFLRVLGQVVQDPPAR